MLCCEKVSFGFIWAYQRAREPGVPNSVSICMNVHFMVSLLEMNGIMLLQEGLMSYERDVHNLIKKFHNICNYGW